MSAPMLSFMWQGGEPTMMGLPFFEDVVRLQMRAVREAVPDAPPAASNAIQTNATMLNDDWARFFKRHNFLVGVSLDGPPEWHDSYRVDWKGRPTHDRVAFGHDAALAGSGSRRRKEAGRGEERALPMRQRGQVQALLRGVVAAPSA